MAEDLVVVGLGYVGRPLVQEAVRSGHRVVGLDVSDRVVDGLNAGRSHIDDLADSDIDELRSAGFRATTDPACLDAASVVVICVPTPLDDQAGPDLGAVMSATRSAAASRYASSRSMSASDLARSPCRAACSSSAASSPAGSVRACRNSPP